MADVFLCKSCKRAARDGRVPMLFGFVRVVGRGQPSERSELAKACQHERWNPDRMRNYGAAETMDEIARYLRARIRAGAANGSAGGEDGRTGHDLPGELRARGYWPCEGVYELTVFGNGTVRISGGEECTVQVFGAGSEPRWSARFTLGTPDAAVLALIDAAEADLGAGGGRQMSTG